MAHDPLASLRRAAEAVWTSPERIQQATAFDAVASLWLSATIEFTRTVLDEHSISNAHQAECLTKMMMAMLVHNVEHYVKLDEATEPLVELFRNCIEKHIEASKLVKELEK